MPASGNGTFREEYCPFHMQVEWEVSYETLDKCGYALKSPVFKIERQSYMLESERWTTDHVVLSLLRMGPSDSEHSAQYWAGLKRTDGVHDHTVESGRVNLKRNHKSWEKEASLGITSRTDLYRLYRRSDGHLTFFFRMNIKRVPVGVETCRHGPPQMPKPESGGIRLEECSYHKHVEWNINYETQHDDANKLTSPVIKFDTQIYFFQMWTCQGKVFLELFRLGHSLDGPATSARCWIGLKCHNGTYYPRNYSEKLNLREDFGLWTRINSQVFYSSDIEKQYLTMDRRLTFFFRMNVESDGAKLCIHSTRQAPPQSEGSIREEQCSSHKQVEWNVGYKVLQDRSLYVTSPVFKVGTQKYFFESCFSTTGDVRLRLFRRGISVRGPASIVRYWVGLKCSDGTCRFKNFNQQLDLREEFGLWTEMAPLMNILHSEMGEQYLTLDSRLTILFRMNTEPTGLEMCIHGSTEKPASVLGTIREEECSSHKHVEWDVDYEVLQEHKLTITSPVFNIGTQLYYMEFVRSIVGNTSFSLYRLGQSVEGAASLARYWAGLKNVNGTYHLRNFSDTLDLQEHFGLWTVVASFVIFPPLEFERKHIKNRKRIPTFFFRMNCKQAGVEMCTHSLSKRYAPRDEGCIQTQECPSHKHVLWDVAYESLREEACFSTSPVFKVGNQWYQLNLCCCSQGPVTLDLYRSGSSVHGPTSSVRCWAGLKRGNGSYHHHVQRAQFDLREECSLPTKMASFTIPDRSYLERTHVTSDGRLTFFLQTNILQWTFGEETCAYRADEMYPSGEGCIREKDKSVEWDVGYEVPREYTHSSTSPVFKIGAQCYLLELCYELDGILSLSLYRFGSSVEGPARYMRCWAGLKRDRGMYYYNIEGVEIDLRRDCELWKKVTILGYFRCYDLEKHSLTRDGRLKFFFVISAEARGTHGPVDVAVQTDGNSKQGHADNTSGHSEALRTDRNSKGGHKDKIYQHSKDFEKLREHFRLWLQHPEDGDRIRRLRMEAFEARQGKYLELHFDEDKEPQIFAA